MQLTLSYGFFDFYRSKTDCGIYVRLSNSTDHPLTINRDEFSLVSARGFAYQAEPFKESDHPGIFSKLITYPSIYTIPPRQEVVYVFSWINTQKVDHRSYLARVKSDTAAFIHRTSEGNEVLCRLALKPNALH